MAVQELAWPKGKPRSEAIEDWFANEEQGKRLSDMPKANPQTAVLADTLVNRSAANWKFIEKVAELILSLQGDGPPEERSRGT